MTVSEARNIRQQSNCPVQGDNPVVQSVRSSIGGVQSKSMDLIDGLAAAASMADTTQQMVNRGMNIEIINSKSIDQEYTWLGVVHANQTASQIRVDQNTSEEMIEDILESFGNHPYSGITRVVLLYAAHGLKFDAELSMATFTDDFSPEDAAGLLKSVYGENGVEIIDYTTYNSVYSEGDSTYSNATGNGGLGVDADLVKRSILSVIRKSKPERREIEIPNFMTRG